MPANKYLRPPFILSKIINPIVVMFGLVTVLTVKGRKSGKWFKVPITPVEHENHIYLVAPRGETQWARNLRVNSTGKLTKKGKTRAFKATEISGNVQIAVVKHYQKVVPAVKSQFLSLPDPKDHPTFKLEFIK